MYDDFLEKINDNVFKEKVENHLRKFIKDVSDIKTDSCYRVLYTVRIVNMHTGNIIDIERD